MPPGHPEFFWNIQSVPVDDGFLVVTAVGRGLPTGFRVVVILLTTVRVEVLIVGEEVIAEGMIFCSVRKHSIVSCISR